MTRVLAFIPGLTALLPWLLLRGVGAQESVVVITGMLPPGAGPEAFLLGPAYVLAYLLAVVVAPPLLITPMVWTAARYIAGHVVSFHRGTRR